MSEPTHREKLLVVLKAARAEIAPAVKAGVGLDAETIAKLDRILAAGQRAESARIPVAFPPEPSPVLAHPRFQV